MSVFLIFDWLEKSFSSQTPMGEWNGEYLELSWKIRAHELGDYGSRLQIEAAEQTVHHHRRTT